MIPALLNEPRPGQAPQSRPFMGNPWGITRAEAAILVRLPDKELKTIAKELEVSMSTIRSQTQTLTRKMGVTRMLPAAIYWDRWWQKWAVTNPIHAGIAKEQLGL